MNNTKKESNDYLQKIKNRLNPYILNIVEDYGAEGKKEFYEELYKCLKVKHGINLYKRKTESINKNKALMDYVRENEYAVLKKEILALLYKFKVIS